MESAKFELTIKKYFEKAGVVLLKKGADFAGDDETPSFLLLDTKRKSFYLTETDISDDTDFEINATLEYFVSDMPQSVKAAILRLGRADARSELPTPNLYSLDGLVRKSALIISEQYALQVTTFLKAKGAVFQSVPFKGAFMVYFLDLVNAEKLVAIYTAASQALHEHGKEDKAPDAEAVLSAISEPTMEYEKLPESEEVAAAFSFDSLIADVEPSGPKKTENFRSYDSLLNESDADVDKLIADIDLNKLIPSYTEDVPEPLEKADLMYAKIINEQIDEHESSFKAPRERNISEMAQTIIAEERASAKIDEEARPEQALLLNKDTFEPLPKQKPTQKITQTESVSKGRIVHKIAANAAGVIFYTPAYLIGKLTSRFFPPFIIYWLAAIAVIFGVYQYIWMIPGTMLYNTLLDSASVQVNLLFEIPPQDTVAEMAGRLITFSSIMFAGLVKAADGLSSGWLLRYLVAFGAVLMIFPYGRAFGARIVAFSLFLYFAAPLIITAQVFAINSAIVMITSQPDSLSVGAASIFASVFFIPVAALVVLFVIAGWILPFGAKCENEVLP